MFVYVQHSSKMLLHVAIYISLAIYKIAIAKRKTKFNLMMYGGGLELLCYKTASITGMTLLKKPVVYPHELVEIPSLHSVTPGD